ncbi:GTPase [Geobacter sp. DSM 9736]|uniref:roadblock/LC7 domain-containing protein n=1 Tax=Geobacter sp. DSM 9736 TaxID=1277350 RepID=UPI000B504FBE|nr:GTPase [Geobacter sp. DSM 9736]SNB46183.1 Predicted regulator of Ras-like GTPase activity, Roadblock/LC7/MglB family [Geobacter sp. DSM 9736]
MKFRDTLSNIVDGVGGGLGAVIMGCDGIAIDEYLPESSLDIQALAVEYVAVMNQTRNLAESLGCGSMEEVCISTSAASILIRYVNRDFFLVLVTDRNSSAGKGRFLLRQASLRLREELER